MSELRASAQRIAQMGRFPRRPAERLLACEKAAAALDNRPSGSLAGSEPWDDFLRRIGAI